MALRLSIRVAWVNLVPPMLSPQGTSAREQAAKVNGVGWHLQQWQCGCRLQSDQYAFYSQGSIEVGCRRDKTEGPPSGG